MKFSSRNNSNYTPKYIKFPIDKSPFNIYRKWTTERTCSHSLNRLPIFAFLSRVFLFFSVFFVLCTPIFGMPYIVYIWFFFPAQLILFPYTISLFVTKIYAWTYHRNGNWHQRYHRIRFLPKKETRKQTYSCHINFTKQSHNMHHAA